MMWETPRPKDSYHNTFFRYGELLLLLEPAEGAKTVDLACLPELPKILRDHEITTFEDGWWERIESWIVRHLPAPRQGANPDRPDAEGRDAGAAPEGPDPDSPLLIRRGDEPERLLVRVKLQNWISAEERQKLVEKGGAAYDRHHAKQRDALVEVSTAVKRLNRAVANGGVPVGACRLAAASPNWLAAPFQCG